MSVARVLYDAKGRPTQVSRAALPWATRYDENGAPLVAPRELTDLEFAAAADPGSRLGAGGFVYTGGQWSVDLTGSWGSTDCTGAWPYRVSVLKDFCGIPVRNLNQTPGCMFAIQLTSTHNSTDEYCVGVMVANAAVLTGSTVDCRGIGLVGTGAGGSGWVAGTELRSTNGTGNMTNGTTASGVVAATGGVKVLGADGPQMFSFVIGLDSSGNRVANTGSSSNAGTIDYGTPTTSYITLVAGRLSAAATSAITVTFKVWLYPMFVSPFPWVT